MSDEFGHGGIVDQNIQTAEFVRGCPDKFAAVRIDGNICLNNDGFDSGIPTEFTDFFGFGTAAVVINDYRAAFFREADGGRPAYAGRASRNQCRLPLQFHVCFSNCYLVMAIVTETTCYFPHK